MRACTNTGKSGKFSRHMLGVKGLRNGLKIAFCAVKTQNNSLKIGTFGLSAFSVKKIKCHTGNIHTITRGSKNNERVKHCTRHDKNPFISPQYCYMYLLVNNSSSVSSIEIRNIHEHSKEGEIPSYVYEPLALSLSSTVFFLIMGFPDHGTQYHHYHPRETHDFGRKR